MAINPHDTQSTHAPATGSSVVNTFVQNSTGIIELNRPKALNSLNQEMVDLIREALDKWIDDDAVHRVLIYSASERAFCAGGDVRAVREAILEGDQEVAVHYFVEEFMMNDDLGTFPKPVISVIDGVVMGGGLGVSMHGSHRVVTEKSFASMPEMAIGYTPDVGFTYFIQQVTSLAIGKFLAVTGWRMSPADMLWAGVATDFIESKDVGAFQQTIIERSLEEALDEFRSQPEEESRLAQIAADIEATFDFGSWKLIDEALTAHGDQEFIAQVRELMSGASPSAVVAAIVLMEANRDAGTLRKGLDNELVISLHMLRQPDFAEGVRAVLVDKDRNPAFQPATSEQVDETVFQALLA